MKKVKSKDYSKKIKSAVFISGRGTNFKSLLNFSKKKISPIKINLLITDNKKAKGIFLAKKNQILEPFINVSTSKLLEKIFRESLVIELMWENKIDFKIDNSIKLEDVNKITFFKLFRKYLSKKIRSLYR